MVIETHIPKTRNAKVFIRVLPKVKNCWEYIKILQDRKGIYVRSRQTSGVCKDYASNYWNFYTDGVFSNETQKEVYDIVTKELLKGVFMQGKDAVIVAYGQTGSGKSMTINSANSNYEDRGIIPRLLSDVFIYNTHNKDAKMAVEISYIEIQRNAITDLLIDPSLSYDVNAIKCVSKTKVLNESQAIKLLFIGDARRTIIQRNFYNSHMGHAVFSIKITMKSKLLVNKKIITTIHVVDLAGADISGYDTCDFKSSYEVGTGNLAKTQLEQFLLVLGENSPEKTAVFQRLNILIQYLKNELNDSSLLRFIGHIRSRKEDLIVTLSMLRFAQSLRGLKSRQVKQNFYDDESMAIHKLEVALDTLRKELDLHAMLTNENIKTNITQERIAQMESAAEDYLLNRTNELVVLNVSDATTVMRVFKNLYHTLQVSLAQLNGSPLGSKVALDDVEKKVKRSSSSRTHSRSLQSQEGRGSRTSKLSASSKVGTASRTENPSQSNIKRSSTGSRRISNKPSDPKKSEANVSRGNDEPVPVPIALPEHAEAFSQFVAENYNSYSELQKELESYTEAARLCNVKYLDSIAALQECYSQLESRKRDLLKAKMKRELECNNEDESILSELEKICFGNIKTWEVDIIKWRETVLQDQSLIKMYLEHIAATKSNISQMFDEYCKDRFKTSIPNLQELATIEETNKSGDQVKPTSTHMMIENDVENSKLYEVVLKYNQMKQFREKELLNNNKKISKCKKWIHSLKP